MRAITVHFCGPTCTSFILILIFHDLRRARLSTTELSYLQRIDNYIGSQIKNIKTIMNDGLDRDLHNILDFQKSAFTKPKEEINHIYLTMDEILAIKKIDYSGRPDLDVARDLFVIAAVTGLRVSDYKKLSVSNI